jgi:glycosyltransferase involved in cell wall biosynthesis
VRQSYRNIELIVVDGGSRDGTQNVLNEYAEHISVLLSEPDNGIYDAMNKVCSLATGDWLIFLGCDDVLLDALSDIAESLNRPDAVYYGDAIFRSNGIVSGGKFSKYKLMNWNICHQAVFYPGPVYKKYSYSLDYKWLADYDYNIRLFGDEIPFVYLGKAVSIYNDKGGSSLGDAEFEKKKLKLIRESFGITYLMIKFVRNVISKVVSARKLS